MEHAMTAAARIAPNPRYGSPAQAAAFLGVSTKTVRRAVASGALPSYRVGRRVLVSFRDADQFVRRAPTMPLVQPTETIDPATGKARPLSDEERERRSEALYRALDEIDEIGDETDADETWSDVFRGIDASRPHRPLFEGRH